MTKPVVDEYVRALKEGGELWSSGLLASAVHPKLSPYVTDDFLYAIKHPLITSPALSPTKLEQIWLERSKAVAEGYAEGRIALAFYEKPYRLLVLRYMLNGSRPPYLHPDVDVVTHHLTDEVLRDALAFAWTTTESMRPQHIGITRADVIGMFRRLGWVDDDDGGPVTDDTVTLYRGVQDARARGGLSWTSDLDRAIWFSERYRATSSFVYCIDVPASYVLARFTGRNESEYVVNIPSAARRGYRPIVLRESFNA